jgi:excisionase family DNA binding protein
MLLVAEVAKLLRTSTRNVTGWANSGKLPGFKVGRQWRLWQSDVLKYLAEQEELAGIED